MSKDVIVALISFGKTLEDDNVDVKTKLQVLHTLNESPLTLSELSDSGVGRAVRSLKSAPGNLGTTARLLVGKWKQLLRNHMTKVNGNVNEPTGCNKSTIQQETTSNSIQKKTVKSSQLTKVPQTHPQESVSNSTIIPRTRQDEVERKPPSTSTGKSTNQCSTPAAATKRSSSNHVDSLDSTSGLSFMESLNVVSAVSIPKKRKIRRSALVENGPLPHSPPTSDSCTFLTNSFLSSLSEDIGKRPDVIHPTKESPVNQIDDAFDDGDLKFKSKKILWVPKPCSSRSSMANSNGDCFANSTNPLSNGVATGPPSLVDICVDVVGQNLKHVDQVGSVPYELLSRVLQLASAEDLARIESCNPHFSGCSDDLWERHIKRKFPHVDSPNPRPGESWCDCYKRLSAEQAKRLDRIISKSARKIREEQEARRITLPTEVITPRQVQRRAARQLNSAGNCRAPTKRNTSHLPDPSPVFCPYNVSRPSANNALTTSATRTVPTNSLQNNTKPKTKQTDGGGLLNKLRKQLRYGGRRM